MKQEGIWTLCVIGSRGWKRVVWGKASEVNRDNINYFYVCAKETGKIIKGFKEGMIWSYQNRFFFFFQNSIFKRTSQKVNWKGSKNGYRETKNIEVIKRSEVVTCSRMVEARMRKRVYIWDMFKMNTNIKKKRIVGVKGIYLQDMKVKMFSMLFRLNILLTIHPKYFLVCS